MLMSSHVDEFSIVFMSFYCVDELSVTRVLVVNPNTRTSCNFQMFVVNSQGQFASL